MLASCIMVHNKFIVCLGDGMADEPLESLNGKTPLQAAYTPNMDALVQEGKSGLAQITPPGLYPGSDIANMSILGYDPKIYHTGRGPIEAASLGIRSQENELIFRCNLTNVSSDMTMQSFTADHISTRDATVLIDALNNRYNKQLIKFHTGVSYRHIMIASSDFKHLKTIAPHDIVSQNVLNHLPNGKNEDEMKRLLQDAHVFLSQHAINKEREKNNLKTANFIWPWSQGKTPEYPSFNSKYGLKGAMITAVDLLKGLAFLSGMTAPNIKGATGFIDTDYQAKMSSAMQLLKEHDFVYIHIEAPDEAGHLGDEKIKIKAIEDFDKKVVGVVRQAQLKDPSIQIMVLPDHPTPCARKTHTAGPVPVVLKGTQFTKNNGKYYSETDISAHKWNSADDLLLEFLNK